MPKNIDKLKVVKWLRSGEFNTEDIKRISDIIDQGCNLLDGCCSHEICGECLFKASDGKYYVGTVEFIVGEANPDYVKDTLEEDKNEDKDEVQEQEKEA